MNLPPLPYLGPGVEIDGVRYFTTFEVLTFARQAQSEAVAAYKAEMLQKYEADTERATEEWNKRETVAEIEAALPAMREYARKNPKHHFSTDGTEQDPNGAHAWLERNDKPNTEIQRR